MLERCFGWRGLLVEGHPILFERLRQNRPSSLSIHLAACATEGWAQYEAWPWTGAKIKGAAAAGAKPKASVGTHTHLTECAPVGERLLQIGVQRLDLVSIDVEGSELTVVESLLRATKGGLSIGVILVEVRPDGQRRTLMTALLGAGLRYVGQLRARASEANDVVDDCYVNATHHRHYFPQSSAAAKLADVDRGGAPRPRPALQF